MNSFFRRQSSASTVLLSLGIAAGAMTPIVISTPALSQTAAPTITNPAGSPYPSTTTSFSDVGVDYWARPFIQALAARNVISGFPDGTFRPQEPVDRAEFAAMIQKAFSKSPVRQLSSSGFRDVSPNYWGASAIKEAYETGFMTGYPGDLFLPNQEITKVQALVALTNGLNLAANSAASNSLNTYYSDAFAVPTYAVNNVVAATDANLVVNYPNVRQLNPLVPITRAEAAALIYQALVRQGQLQPLANNLTGAQYIVSSTTGTTSSTQTSTQMQSTGSSTQTSTQMQSTANSTNGIDVGRATRGGRSYIGIGGNIGLTGSSALSDGNFTVISKLGLTRNISLRPSAVIGDNPVVLVPITLDFAPQSETPFGGNTFTISPYLGAGVAIDTSHDTDVGAMLTGGVDVPLGSRFTANASVNAAFLRDTDVGIVLGVGYNF